MQLYIFIFLVFLFFSLASFLVINIIKVFKTDYKTIYILCFFILLFLGIQVGAYNTSVSENRTLATWQPLKKSSIKHWSGNIDNYLNDNFGFRSLFLNLYTKIDYFLFNKSPNKAVLIGQDGWKFGESEVYENYMKIKTNEQILNSGIINQLNELDLYLKKSGIDLIIEIIPSKSNLYSNYLPKWIDTSHKRESILTFMSLLQSNTSIEILDLYDYLIKDDYNSSLYYKNDSHWNAIGAYKGIEQFLVKLNTYGYEIDIKKKLDFYNRTHISHFGDYSRLIRIDEKEEIIAPILKTNIHSEEISLKDNIRNEYDFKSKITEWKKLKVHYNNQEYEDTIVPIIVGDSFYLSSDGSSILKLFNKTYAMHYEELYAGLPILISNTNDSDILILSFVDWKFMDGQYNSFYNNIMKINFNNERKQLKIWEKELPF